MFTALNLFLRTLRRRSSFEAEMSEEITSHIEARAEDLIRVRHLTREQALREARLEFGSVETIRDECRRSRGLRWVDHLSQDLRYALRALRTQPVFASVAVLTLAFGIGANSAIFSVLDRVLLRSLPVPAPHELHTIALHQRTGVSQQYSWPFARKVMTAVSGFARAAAMSRTDSVRLGHEGERRVTLQLVSGSWFDVVGLRPLAGRFIEEGDNNMPGGHPVAVVSHAFWQKQFGDEPFRPGQTILLRSTRFEIIGVAPHEFSGVIQEAPVDVWAPLMMQQDLGYYRNFMARSARPNDPWAPQENIRWLEILVRCPENSTAALTNTLNSGLAEYATGPDKAPELRLIPESFARGSSLFRAQLAEPLIIISLIVGLVLLMVCVNLANLLLARASSRRREMAVRLSMGASRARLMGQLLTESLLLSGISALCGLLIAHWGTTLLAAIAATLGMPGLEADVDGRVLAFTAGASVLTALLFGLLPALRATRVDPAPELKSGAREVSGGSKPGLAGVLVTTQVALSLVLVCSAGLFLRSLQNLLETQPGFRPQSLVRVGLNIRDGVHQEALQAYLRSVQMRVRSLHGVEDAAVAVCGLLSDCRIVSHGVRISGYTPTSEEQVTIQENAVSPGYFRTTGITLIAGREFTADDTLNHPRVAVVNEALARKYFPARAAIGQRIGYERLDTLIVGVVRDAHINTIREQPVPMAWYPMAQQTSVSGPGIEVRVTDNSVSMEHLRQAVNGVDSRVHVSRIYPYPAQIKRTVSRELILAGISGTFGGVALLLAAIGLFGLMSYSVSRRTAEFGLRIALGASPTVLLWQTLRQCMTLTGIGLLAGIILLVPCSALVGKLLFQVGPRDPYVLVTSAAVLLVSAAIAGYLPLGEPRVSIRPSCFGRSDQG